MLTKPYIFHPRCEIHLHAVDPTTYQVLPVEKVLETIDSKYDELKDVYQEYGVETLIAASATSKGMLRTLGFLFKGQ